MYYTDKIYIARITNIVIVTYRLFNQQTDCQTTKKNIITKMVHINTKYYIQTVPQLVLTNYCTSNPVNVQQRMLILLKNVTS